MTHPDSDSWIRVESSRVESSRAEPSRAEPVELAIGLAWLGLDIELTSQCLLGRGAMADAITWKYVSKEQVDRLADHHAMDDCRRELAQVFKIDLEDKKQCFLLDFHVHNYSFCRQAHLHPEQISVLLGILQLLMEKDFADDSQTTLEQSYQAFQKLLLDHSVERSPKSVQLFSSNEVAAIVDFVTNTYFRHFHLYKCVFTPLYHTHVVQKPMNDVQLPPAPRPLSEAFMHIVHEVKIETESSPTPVES